MTFSGGGRACMSVSPYCLYLKSEYLITIFLYFSGFKFSQLEISKYLQKQSHITTLETDIPFLRDRALRPHLSIFLLAF